MSRRAVSTVACLTLVCFMGCGGGGPDKFQKARPKTAKASGTVTYKGQPLADAIIVCSPKATGDKAVSASATSDASGNFTLMAFPPDKGAVPGDYQVTIMKNEAVAAAAKPGSHDAAPAAAPKSLIPEKYNKAETSGLTLTIPEAGKADIKFELVD